MVALINLLKQTIIIVIGYILVAKNAQVWIQINWIIQSTILIEIIRIIKSTALIQIKRIIPPKSIIKSYVCIVINITIIWL